MNTFTHLKKFTFSGPKKIPEMNPVPEKHPFYASINFPSISLSKIKILNPDSRTSPKGFASRIQTFPLKEPSLQLFFSHILSYFKNNFKHLFTKFKVFVIKVLTKLYFCAIILLVIMKRLINKGD